MVRADAGRRTGGQTVRRGGGTGRTATITTTLIAVVAVVPVPSFDGSIAGTGVVSRLACLDGALARDVVRAYLDSNAASARAMPLRHSLAYFRQLLSGHANAANAGGGAPHIPENMARGARNVALLLTLLGAAYRLSQGGCVDDGGGGALPGGVALMVGAVLSDETVEAIKNLMIKVGLAGGFLRAGMIKTTTKTTTKEREARTGMAAAASSTTRAAGEGAAARIDADADDGAGVVGGRRPPRDDGSSGTNPIDDDDAEDASGANRPGDGGAPPNFDGTSSSPMHQRTTTEPSSSSRRRRQGRSLSIGSLKDLSKRMPNPTAITSMLYNALSGGVVVANGPPRGAPTAVAAPRDGERPNPDDPTTEMPALGGGGAHPQDSSSPRRRHRSKRSHKTLRQGGGYTLEDPIPIYLIFSHLSTTCGF